MPSSAFERALPFVLRWEGGYVDHPADPGGRTNKGVTQRVYDAWRARRGLPARHVKEIEDAEIVSLYESDYWLPPRCDLLRQQLDLVQFDTAVNMGPRRSVRFLQASVGCPVDGDFGPQTSKAAEACDVGVTMAAYCDRRETFYRRLVEQKGELKIFLKGWLNRLDALRKEIGLPGYEGFVELDFGETGFVAKVPDLGEDADVAF